MYLWTFFNPDRLPFSVMPPRSSRLVTQSTLLLLIVRSFILPLPTHLSWTRHGRRGSIIQLLLIPGSISSSLTLFSMRFLAGERPSFEHQIDRTCLGVYGAIIDPAILHLTSH